jgi:ribose transport system substrate-binding protein
MKKRLLVMTALLAVMTMAVYGNGQKAGGETSAPARPARTAAQATAELYALLPKVALTGVEDLSSLQDRAAIEKAWPRKLRTPGRVVIGWTDIAPQNPWFVAVKASAEAKAKELGFELTYLYADGDVAKQTQQIESFISRNVDIIVVDPCDVQGVVNDIKAAVAAGIPVLCIGSAPGAGAPILTTLCDNAFMVGYNAGLYAGAQFGKDEEINMGCIPGMLGNTSGESRVSGIVSGMIAARMKANGTFMSDADSQIIGYEFWEKAKTSGKASLPEVKMNILAIGEGKWSEEGGLTAAEPIITANGAKLNFMCADNEFQCFGILKAVRAAGLTGKIKVGTCADGFNQALSMVAGGELLMSGSWNGDQQGAHAIEFINAIFNRDANPGNLPFGSYFNPLTFTNENAAAWINTDPNANFFAVPPFEFPKSIPALKSGS